MNGIGLRGIDLDARMDFKPNLEVNFEYFLSTNSGEVMDYEIYAKGDLKEYWRKLKSNELYKKQDV